MVCKPPISKPGPLTVPQRAPRCERGFRVPPGEPGVWALTLTSLPGCSPSALRVRETYKQRRRRSERAVGGACNFQLIDRRPGSEVAVGNLTPEPIRYLESEGFQAKVRLSDRRGRRYLWAGS